MKPEFTRRRVLRAALAASGTAALPAPLLAAAPASFLTSLEAALVMATPAVPGARLDLVGFHQSVGAGGDVIVVDLCLDWPPGQRRRRIAAPAPTYEAALAALREGINAAFGHLT